MAVSLGEAFIAVHADGKAIDAELQADVDATMAKVAETSKVALGEVDAQIEASASRVSALGADVAASFEAASAGAQQAFLRVVAAADSAAARVVAAQNAQTDAIAKVASAEQALAKVQAESGASADALAAAQDRVAAAQRGAETATARVTAVQAAQEKSTADLAAAEGRLAAGDEAATSSIGGHWKGLAGIVAGAAVVEMVKGAGDYQQSLTKLQTTAGESAKNLSAVGDGMLQMAGQVGISAQELAQGMYTVDSSGIHGAASLTVLKAAAEGAKQENAGLTEVVDAVTTALHDYNLPASDAAKVTSQLVAAVSNGKTNFNDLTGAMHSITPLAAATGMSLAQVAGALAGMTASGMHADQAAQNLASSIRSFSKPTGPMIAELSALGLNAQDLSDKLGQRGIAGTLQVVSDAIVAKLGPSGKVAIAAINQNKTAIQDLQVMLQAMPPDLAKLSSGLLDGSTSVTEYTKAAKSFGGPAGAMGTQFLGLYKSSDGFSQVLKSGGPAVQTYIGAMGKAVGTAEGLSVALQLTGEHTGSVNKAIGDVAKATGDAAGNVEGWSAVQGNFNTKISQAVAQVKSWAIQIGQVLIPVLTGLVGGLLAATGWLSKHTGLVKAIVVPLGILLGLWVTYKTVMKAGELATTAWSTATKVATTVQKLLGLATVETNAAFTVSPIGLIVTLVIALAAAVIYAYTHFTWFRDAVKAVGSALKDAALWVAHMAEVVWGALKTAFDWVVGHWPLILEILAGPIGWAIALFTNFGPQIMGALASAGKAILGWVTDAAGFLASLPGRAWDALVTFGPRVAAAVGNGLLAAIKAVGSFVLDFLVFWVTLPVKVIAFIVVLWIKIGQAFWAGIQYLIVNVPIWIDSIISFFAALPGKAWNALLSLEGKLHDAIWAAIDYLIVNVPIWIDSIISFFAALPGKAWNALLSLEGMLHNAIWAAIDYLIVNVPIWFDAVVSFFASVPGRIFAVLSGMASVIGNAFSSAFSWARSLVVQGVDDIVSFIGSLPGRIGALAGSMASIGGKLINSLWDGLMSAGSWIGNIGQKVLNAIIGFINTQVIDRIDSALNFSVMGVSIHAGVIPHIPQLADGAVVNRPTLALIGEAGPEAVVPLSASRAGSRAAVMGAAGLSGGGMSLTYAPQLVVPQQATAESVAAIVGNDLSRSLRLGLIGGDLGGLGVAS